VLPRVAGEVDAGHVDFDGGAVTVVGGAADAHALRPGILVETSGGHGADDRVAPGVGLAPGVCDGGAEDGVELAVVLDHVRLHRDVVEVFAGRLGQRLADLFGRESGDRYFADQVELDHAIGADGGGELIELFHPGRMNHELV